MAKMGSWKWEGKEKIRKVLEAEAEKEITEVLSEEIKNG